MDDNSVGLREVELALSERAMSPAAEEFVAAGRGRFKTVSCFEFVPCDELALWRTLDALPRGRFCEWGSGFGIGCGLASLLGFEALGIEIDAPLAEASRTLLTDFNLPVTIETGSYFEIMHPADVYFVYCWPGRITETQKHFVRTAPAGAKLLIGHGQADIRCKMRVGDGSES